MATIYGHSTLYGIATTSITGYKVFHPHASLSAGASLYAYQGSLYLSSNLDASANIALVQTTMDRYTESYNLGNSYVDALATIFTYESASAHLTCQSSFYGIPNLGAQIKEGQASLQANATVPTVRFTTVSYNSCHMTTGNCYAPGYYAPGYVMCQNMKATGYIAVYGAATIIGPNADITYAWIGMDWTRNNTWRIGQLCRIQQQLARAMLELTRNSQDHLVANDVQPLFDEFDKMLFEVQDV